MANAFSLWCDFIEQSFLDGDFVKLISQDTINGATSNPAIFKQALSNASYLAQKGALKAEGKAPKEIYETLAKADIARAAELLAPLHAANVNDGYVSIEVDPNFCDDAKATIAEGARLYAEIGYKNVMIKIPATKAGYTAMSELLAQGISINATLVFTKEQVRGCMEAFKRGYEKLREMQGFSSEPECLPRAVVSVFVSRFDRALDGKLAEAGIPKATLGVKNAQRLYHMLNAYELPAVRILFASTGVKGGELHPAYYIKELYHPHAINTAPLSAIAAFEWPEDDAQMAYLPSIEELEEYFSAVKNAGINVEACAKELLKQGLADFKEAFASILASLE